MNDQITLLEVNDLAVHFGVGEKLVRAVDGLSFRISTGETIALVGESGSGKSISALALTRLVPAPGRYVSGEVILEGSDLLQSSEGDLRKVRGNRIAYIFQEPSVALNPVFKIGWQIAEAIKLHRNGVNLAEEVGRLLELVDLPARVSQSYPYQLSGGMQQRAMIAMALACEPDILVADEPTTSLDVTVQKKILNLLAELRDVCGLSVLLITHDLGLVSDIVDRLYVMKDGRVVEEGATRSVLKNPSHAYTQQLLDVIPRLHPRKEEVP